MGLLNSFKRKGVPDELPEMPIEYIEEKTDDRQIVKEYIESKAKPRLTESKAEKKVIPQSPKQDQIAEKKIAAPEMDEGFFTELQGNLLKEIDDLNKLEKWYNNKFLPGDVVTDMRSYWENKKTGSILKILGKNFQEKISGRISSLQQLEKEWQDIYFSLVEKENEIKDQEKELKEMLKEFIEVCKRRNGKR